MGIGEWDVGGLTARIRSLWRGLRHRDAIESEMAEEFRHHIELRARDLVRGGLSPERAAREARLEFGHIEGHRIDARASRGLAWFDQLRFSALDVKLGVRMLAKYPGLSVVSVIGMAMAIAMGAGVYSVVATMTDTGLPLPEGTRIVALRNAIATDPGRHQASLSDFVVWRDALTSVQDLAAFATTRRNLVVPGAAVELVRVARMTASGFRVARTTPILGRPLLDEDERADARVIVIGYEEWQRQFAADPGIIGRPVGLGNDTYTVVGVMPERFHFPVNDRYWIPLVRPAERERADSIPVTVLGRLADGASLERAQAELTTIGTRMAAAYPETHERLRPRVVPYTRAFFDIDSPEQLRTTRLFPLFVGLLLVVVAVNVAILIYARTVTRAGEIAVRTALGASRARVVTQLFAEALVLSATAALIGLAIAGVALANLQAKAARRLGELPFWINLELSTGVIAYALVLAIVGAAIVGVVPALKATGHRVQASLQQLSGHGARMQLGRAWTALIVAQIGIAVAVLPFAVLFTEETMTRAVEDVGYPVEEFLEASLTMEGEDAGAALRFRTRATELMRRLESDPAVAGLTISMAGDERIQVEPIPSPGSPQRPINAGMEGVDRVAANFFALYGMPILAGRAFVEADARAGANTVIVNQVFAEDKFGTRAVLGRRIRFVRQPDTAKEVQPGPWLEIVGIVRDFKETSYEPLSQVYLPADVSQLAPPTSLFIRVRRDPATSVAPRLRSMAAAIDPTLQIDGLVSAAERMRQRRQTSRSFAIGAAVVTLSVLLLSAAGIYAMMSFTVAKRRREIGIRSALGADSRRVLSSIFARASAQVAAGILLGTIGTVAVNRVAGRGPVHDGNVAVLLVVAVLMATIGLMAAIGPARRGLAVQPTEALREE